MDIDLGRKLNDHGDLWIGMESPCCYEDEHITKLQAIALIKHLVAKDCFDLKPGDVFDEPIDPAFKVVDELLLKQAQLKLKAGEVKLNRKEIQALLNTLN